MLPTSSSETDPPLNEELVAYLDGELPPNESRRVEERLATDADYRQQLRELDQAWESLESLPATNADDDFARTTIEMVSVAAEREASHRAAEAAAVNRQRFWRWSLGGIAAAAIGFAAARWLMPDANEELIANLPVIYQIDFLSQIDDVAFLEQLKSSVTLDRLVPDSAVIDREFAMLQAASATSLQERRQWVESLPSEQKASLATQFQRFKDLANSPGKQQELRELDQQVRTAADAEMLQKTLLAYGQWLNHRTPGEQDELSSLPTEKRLELVEKYIKEDQEHAARQLSDEDRENLRKEVLVIYEDRKSAFERAMRRQGSGDRPRLEGPLRRQALVVLIWELMWNRERDDSTEERLIAKLSPELQDYWEKLPERRRPNRRDQLVDWIRESMRPRRSPDALEKFFAEKLDNNQRARLLALSRDEMQARLEWLYNADQIGLSGNEAWGGFGWPDGMPPGSPPDGPRRDRDGRRRDRDGRGGPRRDGPPPRESGPRSDRGEGRDGRAEAPAGDRPEAQSPPERAAGNASPPEAPRTPLPSE
jgi:hypothetical protein